MTLSITEKAITFGEGNSYAFSDLASWKVWKEDNGKIAAKIQPKVGKAEVFEVELDAAFRDMNGMPLPEVEYFIISWSEGMKAPKCTVKSGDKFMEATFEIKAPSKAPESRRGKTKGVPGFGGEGDEKPDDAEE